MPHTKTQAERSSSPFCGLYSSARVQ